ncbi:hypothetical protein A2Z22_03360 [Candidatus Woesebacteria bacterium RBG_16_34_12]|uniref:Uncharacterized protein n=1 Tax=Candidatus Woesebacteria bacterium RBG_16_34_12 TaxID=1802480 RepID=A0A1F7XAS3_9BACT|nr:MAG: hypothetical protein A2Z22_03360 [Candidatus Woesebacteria bacterium RBG_16_34_12]
MGERENKVYTFTVKKRSGILGLRKQEVRHKLDTGRADVVLLLSTEQWPTEYRSPLPSEQEKTHWKEYYLVGSEGNRDLSFVRIDRFAGSQQAQYGEFLKMEDAVRILEEAEPAHMTESGTVFLKQHDRRHPA